jgi:hypothetical protein
MLLNSVSTKSGQVHSPLCKIYCIIRYITYKEYFSQRSRMFECKVRQDRENVFAKDKKMIIKNYTPRNLFSEKSKKIKRNRRLP